MKHTFVVFIVIGLLACAQAACPDDCNGHGTCVSDACICDQGFSGRACAGPLPVSTPTTWFIGDHATLEGNHFVNWTDEWGVTFYPLGYALYGGLTNGHRLVYFNGSTASCFTGISPAVGGNYTVSLVSTLPFSDAYHGYVFSGNRPGGSPAIVNNYDNATFGVYTAEVGVGQNFPLTTSRTAVDNLAVIVFSVTYDTNIVVSYNGVIQTIPEPSHTLEWALQLIGCSNLGDAAVLGVGEIRIYNESFSPEEVMEESKSLAYKYVTDLCSLPYINTCSKFATCTNVPGNFTCTCNSGYVGDGYTCTGPGVWFVGDDAVITGTEVASWNDRSFNASTAPFNTGPAHEGPLLNGFKTVSFDVSCLMVSNPMLFVGAGEFSSEWTLAMVSTKSVISQSYYFGGNYTGASPAAVAGYVGDFSFYYCDATIGSCPNRVVTTSATGGFHVLIVSYKRLQQIQTLFDGAYAATSGLYDIPSWRLWFLGCSNIGNYADFSLAEFAVYPAALSQSEMTSLSNSLIVKYGL